MRYTLTIMAGEGPDELVPVLASGDEGVVALAARAILDRLGLDPPAALAALPVPDEAAPAACAWPSRLWTVPAETRLGVRELAEAVGRPRSWVYRHTAPAGDLAPIPHRRLDGLLSFVAGEVRDWLRANEEVKAA